MTRKSLVAICALAGALVFAPSASAQVPPDACLSLASFELEQATILGTPGNDVIRGTDGPDVIVAGDGNDKVWGLGGDDVICGGLGDDRVDGGTGSDSILGDTGESFLLGTPAGDSRTTPATSATGSRAPTSRSRRPASRRIRSR